MADADEIESPGWGDDDVGWGGGDEANVDADDWGEEEEFDGVHVEIEEDEEKGPKFAVHKANEITEMLQENVDELCELIQDEPKENVRLILQFYKWKPGKANECYYGEIEKARIAAGVDVDPKANPPYDTSETECDICLDEVDQSDWLGLSCGHRFCKVCWIDTLEQAARTRDCIKLTCPDDSCKLAITTTRLQDLGLHEIDARRTDFFLDRVRKFTIDNFIACNNTYRYCPGVGCSRIVEMLDSTSLSIDCKCGKSFCWKCSANAHHPAPCKVSEAWEQKNAGATDDDMEENVLDNDDILSSRDRSRSPSSGSKRKGTTSERKKKRRRKEGR